MVIGIWKQTNKWVSHGCDNPVQKSLQLRTVPAPVFSDSMWEIQIQKENAKYL